jgi:hypothetical protein
MQCININESDEIKYLFYLHKLRKICHVSLTQGVCVPQIKNHQLERLEGNKKI